MTALTFARFDLATWMPRLQTLLPLVFIAAIGIALPVPGMAVVGAALVTSLTVSVPFLSDEKARLDTLYGLLPASRGAVVAGRAIAVLAYFVLAAAVATAVTVVVAITRGDAVPVEVILVALGAAAAIVGLATTLQLPVLFRVGYARGRLIAYTPPLALAGLAWLAQATDTIGPIEAAFSGIPAIGILGAGVAVGLLGIAIGTALAARVYRAREL